MSSLAVELGSMIKSETCRASAWRSQRVSSLVVEMQRFYPAPRGPFGTTVNFHSSFEQLVASRHSVNSVWEWISMNIRSFKPKAPGCESVFMILKGLVLRWGSTLTA